MKFFISSISLAIVAVALHGMVEQLLFQAGLSWTLSKVIPYIFCLLFAILALISSILFFKKRELGIVIGILIFFAVLGVDFSLNIIYQGDFSNNSEHLASDNPQFENKTLSVFVIPGCPYCHESIATLQTLKKRNPQLTIELLVSSSDSASMEPYKQAVGTHFEVKLFTDFQELTKLKVNSFPSFLFTNKQGEKYLWTNDTFGVPAKDYIEKNVK